jgi:hypothetical protein
LIQLSLLDERRIQISAGSSRALGTHHAISTPP